MISRKPGFFINYLQKNQDALSIQFELVKNKKKEDEIVYLFVLNDLFNLLLTQEAFDSILEIYNPQDQLHDQLPDLSLEEFKKIFDVITQEGFSELFYPGCSSIKKELSELLQTIFPEINDFNNSIFLLRAYAYAVWLSFVSQLSLVEKKPIRNTPETSTVFFKKETDYFATLLADLPEKPIEPSTFTDTAMIVGSTLLADLPEESIEPSAFTDTAMIVGSTLLAILCAIKAPLFLLLLIPIVSSGFYSRYTNGYYFFQPNNTDITNSSNETIAEKKPTLSRTQSKV